MMHIDADINEDIRNPGMDYHSGIIRLGKNPRAMHVEGKIALA